jgi:hypothetical protein
MRRTFYITLGLWLAAWWLRRRLTLADPLPRLRNAGF